jgi:hypothetical protein
MPPIHIPPAFIRATIGLLVIKGAIPGAGSPYFVIVNRGRLFRRMSSFPLGSRPNGIIKEYNPLLMTAGKPASNYASILYVSCV